MDLPTDLWHELIIHMIESKLDTVTLRTWKQNGNPAVGTLDNMIDFLQTRCQILERIDARSKQRDVAKGNESEKLTKSCNQIRTTQGDKSSTLAASMNISKCYLCQCEHFLYHCDKFLAISVDESFKEVQCMKLCISCYWNDHFVMMCRIEACRECSGYHNITSVSSLDV